MGQTLRTRYLMAAFTVSLCALGAVASGPLSAQTVQPTDSNTTVIDDGDGTFTQTSFASTSFIGAYGDDTTYFSPSMGQPSSTAKAQWTFKAVQPGNYAVYATWKKHSTFAKDATYSAEGVTWEPESNPRRLDQTQNPEDVEYKNRGWEIAAGGTVSSVGDVVVTVRPGSDPRRYTIADAVILVKYDDEMESGDNAGAGPVCPIPSCAAPPAGCVYVRDTAIGPNGCPVNPCGELKCEPVRPSAPACGDAIVQSGEQCDDGNLRPGDSCSPTCQLAACGDGIVSAGETCDMGNKNGVAQGNYMCTAQCTWAYCGDNVVQQNLGEQCDGGSDCARDCKPVPKVACNDGKDNDGDGLIDLNDKGCANAQDQNEGDGTTDLMIESVGFQPMGEVAVGKPLYVAASYINNGPDVWTSPVTITIRTPSNAEFILDPKLSTKTCVIEGRNVFKCTLTNSVGMAVGSIGATFTVNKATCGSELEFVAEISSATQTDSNPKNNLMTNKVKVACGTTTVTCTDTDGGNKPEAYGKVTTSNGQVGSDLCTNEGGPNGLFEYYCDAQNAMQRVTATCQYGCMAGACKPKPVVSVCSGPVATGAVGQNQTLTTDVNNDGVTDARDLNEIIAYYRNRTPVAGRFYDVDGSASFDVQDILLVINYNRCVQQNPPTTIQPGATITMKSAALSCVADSSQFSVSYTKTGITNGFLHLLSADGIQLTETQFNADASSTSMNPPPTGIVPGASVKMCVSSNHSLCSPPFAVTGTACAPKSAVTLTSAVLGCTDNKSTITMSYAATGIDASLHALSEQRSILHVQNWFSPLKTSATAQLSDFKNVSAGTKLMLCHGNNYGVCSQLVTVTGTPCSSQLLTQLVISSKSIGTSDTAVKNQKDVALLRFEAKPSIANVILTTVNAKAVAGSLLNAQNYTLWSDADYNGVVETKLQSGVAVNNNLVTFGDLKSGGQEIAPDRAMTFEIRADVASSLTSNTLQLDFATDVAGYVAAENTNGQALSGIRTNGSCPGTCDISVGTVASKTYALVNQGDLFVSLDSTPTRSRQLLGGTLSDSVLRLQFRAQNEDIDVTDLQISGARYSIDRLELYKDGETTPFAMATISGCGIDQVPVGSNTVCANMDNGQLVIPKGMSQDVIVKARMKSDEQGGNRGQLIRLTVSGLAISDNATGRGAVRARGKISSNNIVANDADTLPEGEIVIGRDSSGPNADIQGNMNLVVFSKIASITNANPDADNTNVPTGVSPVGQFRFTAMENSNTLNGLNKAVVDDMIFNVTAPNVQMAIEGFKFYNKADPSTKVTCVQMLANGTKVSSGLITGSAGQTYYIYCSSFDLIGMDTQLESGESSTFVLEADIRNAKVYPNENSALQISFTNFSSMSLNGSFGVTGSHFQWVDKDTDASAWQWMESSETVVNSTSYKS